MLIPLWCLLTGASLLAIVRVLRNVQSAKKQRGSIDAASGDGYHVRSVSGVPAAFVVWRRRQTMTVSVNARRVGLRRAF